MKVICAGLGKTETTTLAKALRILGHNVCDFQEHFDCHGQEWLDTFATVRLPDFNPPVFWFEEIAAAFPEAKVILTFDTLKKCGLKAGKGVSV